MSGTEKLYTQLVPDWAEQIICSDIRYDEETGCLYWKTTKKRGRRSLETPIGCLNKSGILTVCITKGLNKITIKLHRIAWFLHYGSWPVFGLVHLNNNKQDNRIANLSERNVNAELKICSVCDEQKLLCEMRTGTKTCKLCRYKKHCEWMKDNESLLRKKRKNRYDNGGLERDRKYRSQNVHRIRERSRQYRSIPHNQIANALRCRLRKVLLQANSKKADRTFRLIGCSSRELAKHLESQFQPGMNWENYGNPNGDHTNCWHIDHIVPCSAFDLTDAAQQQTCFHYSNLQPLWGKENMAKSNRLDWSPV